MTDNDNIYNIEDDFHASDRKASKKQRKLASKNDRSKYKKSDQDQIKKNEGLKNLSSEHLLKGRVLCIRPEEIIIDHEGSLISTTLKGSLKQEKKLLKNLLAVGDFVHFEQRGSEAVICDILPRNSVLSRADNLSRKKEQIIATNIDQVIITCSVVSPALKTPLIDRYIIAAKKGNMTPIVVVNKIDLLESYPSNMNPVDVEVDKELFEELFKTYRNLGIKTIAVSTKTKQGIDELKAAMKGKTSVFSGQSGVGKSSLINSTFGTTLNVGGIVERTQKGSHTTSSTSLIPIEEGGFCVDTPGIKSFGIWDLSFNEVQEYFDEIKKESANCYYQDCKHLLEPSCNVKEAVEQGKISPLRFESYCALMASLSQEHRKR